MSIAEFIEAAGEKSKNPQWLKELKITTDYTLAVMWEGEFKKVELYDSDGDRITFFWGEYHISELFQYLEHTWKKDGRIDGEEKIKTAFRELLDI